MTKAKMSVAELEAFLLKEFPQAFASGNIAIERADGESCLIRERFHDGMLRPGGTVSGPTLMALADVAMYVVLLSAIGPVGLAVTTNLTINFLRKGGPGAGGVAGAKTLKLGKPAPFGGGKLMSGTAPGPIAPVTPTHFNPKSMRF